MIGMVKMQFNVIKNFDLNVPSWDKIIKNLEYSLNNNDLVKTNKESFIVSHQAHLIPEVKNVMSKVNAKDAHLYINFIPNTSTFGKHSDPVNVAFWQVQGTTKWTVKDKDYILEKGDMIFVPKNVEHAVHPLTIRAGISFGIGYDD